LRRMRGLRVADRFPGAMFECDGLCLQPADPGAHPAAAAFRQLYGRVESRRAYQIAGVFHEQDIDLYQVQPVQHIVHHVRIEMADSAGGDLYCLDPAAANALCVITCLEVTLDNRYRQFVARRINGGLRLRGPARAG